MLQHQSIFFFDLPAIIFMFVFAYLSNRLGEALRIAPWYKILYGTAVIIITASVLDALTSAMPLQLIMTISLILRFVGGVVSCAVVLRYWIWVFSEFFKN